MKAQEILDKVKGTFKPEERGHLVTEAPTQAEREALEERAVAQPALDAFENDDEWVLRADVPGANPQNTRVWYDDRTGLTLHVRAPDLPQAGRLVVGDGPPRDWHFATGLPDYLDGTQASSQVKQGVLTIRVPKRPHARPRIIPIQHIA